MVRTMKINKWGASLGIRFPREFIQATGLEEKMYVEMYTKGEELIIKKAPNLPTLEELVKECSEWDGKKADSFDFGEPVGREII